MFELAIYLGVRSSRFWLTWGVGVWAECSPQVKRVLPTWSGGQHSVLRLTGCSCVWVGWLAVPSGVVVGNLLAECFEFGDEGADFALGIEPGLVVGARAHLPDPGSSSPVKIGTSSAVTFGGRSPAIGSGNPGPAPAGGQAPTAAFDSAVDALVTRYRSAPPGGPWTAFPPLASVTATCPESATHRLPVVVEAALGRMVP